ncbi:DUF397 domain-containing protein [Streptomyces sp. JNUCC 64]
MDNRHLTQAEWIKSSYSGIKAGDNCIEWSPAHASVTGTVPVRDSKNPSGPVLHLPAHAFASFVGGVKSGKFAG